MKTPPVRLRCFLRPAPFPRRLAVMMAGVLIQGLGLAALRAIDLGLDPCSCLTQGVSRLSHLSFGTCQVLCHLINFLIVIRFDLSRIGYGTLGNMVLLGYISDLFTWVFRTALPEGFFAGGAARYILLAPALAVFLFGAAAYMCSGLGSSPYDAVPFILSAHVKRLSFRWVRVCWDVGFMALGLILGVKPGIVTVATAFFLGPIIAWVQKKLEASLFAEKT